MSYYNTSNKSPALFLSLISKTISNEVIAEGILFMYTHLCAPPSNAPITSNIFTACRAIVIQRLIRTQGCRNISLIK